MSNFKNFAKLVSKNLDVMYPTGDQLSGLGFSHTKDANLTLQLTHINGKVDLVTVEFNK